MNQTIQNNCCEIKIKIYFFAICFIHNYCQYLIKIKKLKHFYHNKCSKKKKKNCTWFIMTRIHLLYCIRITNEQKKFKCHLKMQIIINYLLIIAINCLLAYIYTIFVLLHWHFLSCSTHLFYKKLLTKLILNRSLIHCKLFEYSIILFIYSAKLTNKYDPIIHTPKNVITYVRVLSIWRIWLIFMNLQPILIF